MKKFILLLSLIFCSSATAATLTPIPFQSASIAQQAMSNVQISTAAIPGRYTFTIDGLTPQKAADLTASLSYQYVTGVSAVIAAPDYVLVKWDVSYGDTFRVHYCSPVKISDFVAIGGWRSLDQAVNAAKAWVWNTLSLPPDGINPGCINP